MWQPGQRQSDSVDLRASQCKPMSHVNACRVTVEALQVLKRTSLIPAPPPSARSAARPAARPHSSPPRIRRGRRLPECVKVGPRRGSKTQRSEILSRNLFEPIKQLFRKFDRNSDGVIDRTEFRAQIALREPLLLRHADEMFQSADSNCNETVRPPPTR